VPPLQLPAVAGCDIDVTNVEDVDPVENLVAASGVHNERAAAELNRVAIAMEEPRGYIGIAMFVISALRYRARVFLWYGDTCEDALVKYAPWANDAVSVVAKCHAVSCAFRDDGSVRGLDDEALRTNHWVAGFPLDGGGAPAGASLAESMCEETRFFYAQYLSHSVQLVATVTDGDCGLDVMCFMLGWNRSSVNRDALRCELCAYILEHAGNRAFVAMLRHTGEIDNHLGLYELDAAGAALVAARPTEHRHGDGGAEGALLEVPQQAERHYSEEEARALRWKCDLRTAAREIIVGMLKRLPDECANAMVREHATRDDGEAFATEHPAVAQVTGLAVPQGKEIPLALKDKKKAWVDYRRVFRIYQHAVQQFLTSAVAERPVRPDQKGWQYRKGTNCTVRDFKRRRCWGAGRHKACATLREQLAEPYSIMRHSVDVKVTCRFPKKVLLAKALQLQEEYYVVHLNKKTAPQTVQINGRWLAGFMRECRISSRKPNRKFKVPRVVLAERLSLSWVIVSRLRKMVMLHHGYDPEMRNVDQSPFHMNEGLSDCLEKWLLPWGPGRRWELFLLDAYAPGLTDNAQRLCWARGYICVTHGGGASMVCQTNDTDLHLHIRKRFIELQTARIVEKARISGGGMVDLTKEENIDIMAQVISNRTLHVQACKGYKLTGTTVALDGSEDDQICREAKDFWDEMGMRSRIDSAVAEVAEKHAAGLLLWNYKTAQSLITPYPRRGHLDE
ncbi:unnamed protein product, partial [Prorocentrum cordatum]